MAEQADRAYAQLQSLPDNVARSVYLGQLRERNETLYFRVLSDHLGELLPVVCDTAAGQPIGQYPHEHRRPRGIYLSIDRPDDIERSLAAPGLGAGDVDIVVCSDAGDLCGAGDWGVGGARVAAATLAIYTAAAGLRPDRGIPVSLDAGTDNEALLNDPFYPGNRHARRHGEDYEAFIERFVRTASRLFPGALLHFQDFSAGHARDIQQAYPDYRVFDGNMQGTGAAVLAAVYAASRVTGIPMKHQAMLVFGADAAATAIADLVRDAIAADGATGEQARHQVWLADDPGGLARAIDRTAPTILLGASGVHRAFTQQVIEAMCQATRRPLILPLSYPASRMEATPSDVIAWSRGRALVATATPGTPVEYDGITFTVGQVSSALVFPGIGLGTTVSRAARVTPRMLQAAATAIAEQVDTSGPGAPLLPGAHNLRASSAQVAEAVVRAAVADKVATFNPTSLTRAVRDAMWAPDCPDIG